MDPYWLYLAADGVSKALPRNLAYWFGLRVADSFYRADTHGREAVKTNIERILRARGIEPSQGALRGLSRKTFQHFGKYLVDFFRYYRLTGEDLRDLISIEHKEYLEECSQMGNGILGLTAHIGNWELGGAVMTSMGYHVNSVFLPSRADRVNRLFQKQRAKRGINLLPLGHAAMGVMRALKRNELVGLLADRDFTHHDHRLPFFGQPARLPSGPARLAVHTGAPILPAFVLRLVDDSFLLRFYPPIVTRRTDDLDEVQQKIRDVLEHVIGEHPHQWFIFNDFWAANHDRPA